MRIEALSIKAVTVAIFTMVGIIAIVLSLFAGSYFRKAALDAQMNSLSRVIEVASQEMLKEVRGYTFDLGMKLGRSKQFAPALEHADKTGGHDSLEALLDDPFINGLLTALSGSRGSTWSSSGCTAWIWSSLAKAVPGSVISNGRLCRAWRQIMTSAC
jgi:hypothetical protein